MVTIPKSKLEKLTETNESYRKAVIRLNRRKGRSLPGAEPAEDDNAADDQDDDSDVDDEDGFMFGEGGKKKKKPKPGGDVVTKKDLVRRDEQLAIDLASEDPLVDEHWDEIVAFYETPANQSVRGFLTGIRKAKEKWLKLNPQDKPPVDTHKKAASDLGADAGTGKGTEKTPTPPRKHILRQNSGGMEGWYQKKKN